MISKGIFRSFTILFVACAIGIHFFTGCSRGSPFVKVMFTGNKTMVVECVTNHVSFAARRQYRIVFSGDGPIFTGDELTVETDAYVITGHKGSIEVSKGHIICDIVLEVGGSAFEAPFNGRHRVEAQFVDPLKVPKPESAD